MACELDHKNIKFKLDLIARVPTIAKNVLAVLFRNTLPKNAVGNVI
jgi:hypothetical protein